MNRSNKKVLLIKKTRKEVTLFFDHPKVKSLEDLKPKIGNNVYSKS